MADMWAAAEAFIGWLVVLNSVLPAVAVLRRRKLHELVMYQLVASMSLGETLTGAVSVVLGTLKMLELPVASWFCVVAIHLRSSVLASTAVCFFCLSLERFITVIHGLRYYDILTDGRRRLLVAASWIFAAVYFAFGLVLRYMQGIGSPEKMCRHHTSVTFEFRFSGALFCMIAYLVNLGDTEDQRPTTLANRPVVSSASLPAVISPGIHKQSTRVASRHRNVASASSGRIKRQRQRHRQGPRQSGHLRPRAAAITGRPDTAGPPTSDPDTAGISVLQSDQRKCSDFQIYRNVTEMPMASQLHCDIFENLKTFFAEYLKMWTSAKN